MLAFPLLLAACGGADHDSAPPTTAWRPTVACPGDAGCASNAGPLQAGAAALTITPTCFETWDDLDADAEYNKSTEAFHDCGCDRVCPEDEGWAGADAGEGDGVFQALWLAGFGNGRAAAGVHDDLWARTVVVRSGDVTVALVALDVVGFFYDDVQRIRDGVAAAGLDVDHVIVHSTHQHEGPDTLGQWGERLGKRGVDEDWLSYIVDRSVQGVADAVAGLQPATLSVGKVDSAAPFGTKGTRNLVRDSRDPVIVDEWIYTAHLADASGATIATLVNWGNHPEVLSSDNLLITSDFSHYLREGVEQGVAWNGRSTPGVGGVAIYLNAAVGGLMTPLSITVTDGDGVDHGSSDWAKCEALGKLVAELALQAVAAGAPAADPTVSVAAEQIFLQVENFAFQAMFQIGVFDREVYNYDPEANLDEFNIPEVLTEVGVLTLGPVRMLTVPGELTPELAIGGYDGSRVNTDQDDFIDPGNENPPDLSQAPQGPYLKDLLGGEHAWILGLANDELGYLVPPYDYELSETLPYIEEAEGHHYEETNSLGPNAVPPILDAAARLTAWPTTP